MQGAVYEGEGWIPAPDSQEMGARSQEFVLQYPPPRLQGIVKLRLSNHTVRPPGWQKS